MLKTNLIAGLNNNLNFLACSLFLATLFSGTQAAIAQLRLGTGIQQGLEGHLIEYQLQGKPLSNMRGIPGCSVGFGTSCNKTAPLLERIILENSGMTRQDLILKASGGLENYQKFAKFYPSNTDVSSLTSDSFWVNASPYILDRYEHSGIGVLETTRYKELHQIVSNFNSTSVVQNTDTLSLREGIIGLKTAYGRTLLQEAAKIPDIEAKIVEYGLNPIETAFHLQQFQYAVTTLESNNYQIRDYAIYQILSNPYTNIPDEFNRPSFNIGSELDTLDGLTLEGESYIRSIIEGEPNTALLDTPEVIVNLGEYGDTALYVALGGIGLTLLFIGLAALDSGGQSSISLAQSNTGLSLSNSFPDSSIPPIEDLNSPAIQPDIITGQAGLNSPEGNMINVAEPSSNAYLLIVALLLLFTLNKIMKPK